MRSRHRQTLRAFTQTSRLGSHIQARYSSLSTLHYVVILSDSDHFLSHARPSHHIQYCTVHGRCDNIPNYLSPQLAFSHFPTISKAKCLFRKLVRSFEMLTYDSGVSTLHLGSFTQRSKIRFEQCAPQEAGRPAARPMEHILAMI